MITQKLVQTGCPDSTPEDILLHRHLMGQTWNAEDQAGLTCPYCFPFSASPHLAAHLSGTAIDPQILTLATETLAGRFDRVLVEGAGGLMVPLTEEITLLDYLAERAYPMILVTSPRLGSINHTLLSLEAIRKRNITLLGLVYNLHGDTPREIVRDSLAIFRSAMPRYGFPPRIILLPDSSESRSTNWNPLLEPLL